MNFRPSIRSMILTTSLALLCGCGNGTVPAPSGAPPLATVGKASFTEKVHNSSIPVLVDFYADWCGPCRVQTPILEKLAEEKKGVITILKLDVDKEEELSNKYNIESIPCLILFEGGKETKRLVGLHDHGKLIKALGL